MTNFADLHLESVHRFRQSYPLKFISIITNIRSWSVWSISFKLTILLWTTVHTFKNMEAPFEGCTVLVWKYNLFWIYINQLLVLMFRTPIPILKRSQVLFQRKLLSLRNLKQVFNPFWSKRILEHSYIHRYEMYFEAGFSISKPFIIWVLAPKSGFEAKYYTSKLASTSGCVFPPKVSILKEALRICTFGT